MNGLSSVHLFSVWYLKGNPIKMRMAESLKLAAETPDKPFSFRPSSEPQCGTLSMKLDKPQWEKIVKTLHDEFDFMEKQRTKAADLCKEINRYLERKCEEYCSKNNIDFIEWSHFAHSEHRRNFWEVKYKGEVVCGAKVICELTDTNATEASVQLELY